MKNLAFLIAIFCFLNNNVNALGEDDPVYQEELKQLESEGNKNLENIFMLYQHLGTLDKKENNETNKWKKEFIVDNIIVPTLRKQDQYAFKISQFKWKKIKEVQEEQNAQFIEALNVLNQNLDLFNPNNVDDDLLNMD